MGTNRDIVCLSPLRDLRERGIRVAGWKRESRLVAKRMNVDVFVSIFRPNSSFLALNWGFSTPNLGKNMQKRYFADPLL